MPDCQADPHLIQWPEIKLKTLTDTSLPPAIILALFHLFLCLGRVRPLLACISPNSSTASYLSLFLSPSPPEASYLPFTTPSPRPGAVTNTQSFWHKLFLPRMQSAFIQTPQVTVTLAFWTEIGHKKMTDRPPTLTPTYMPLPLKLHSNGLNGAFPMSSGADCSQGEGSCWQFMSQLKVTGKFCASVMKLHLATVINTAQLVQQFNQISSNRFLPHKHKDTFSEHQTGLLQSAANSSAG